LFFRPRRAIIAAMKFRNLDGLPQRAAIHDRLYALISATSSSYQGLQPVSDAH